MTLISAAMLIKSSGYEAIKAMPPLYNIYDNNCQKFVMNLLQIICEPGCTKVATSWSWGVKLGVQLPATSHSEEKEIDAPGKEEGLSTALKLMSNQTPKIKEQATSLAMVTKDDVDLAQKAAH